MIHLSTSSYVVPSGKPYSNEHKSALTSAQILKQTKLWNFTKFKLFPKRKPGLLELFVIALQIIDSFSSLRLVFNRSYIGKRVKLKALKGCANIYLGEERLLPNKLLIISKTYLLSGKIFKSFILCPLLLNSIFTMQLFIIGSRQPIRIMVF